MKKLLLVVDYQKDFVDGALGFPGAEALDGPIAEKIAAYRAAGDDVAFTMDTHQENYLDTQEGRKLPVPHCIMASEGWKLYGKTGQAQDKKRDMVSMKPTFPSLWLGNWLRDQKYGQVELVGLVSYMCVISNAVVAKAALPEAEIIIDAACTAGPDAALCKFFRIQAAFQHVQIFFIPGQIFRRHAEYPNLIISSFVFRKFIHVTAHFSKVCIIGTHFFRKLSLFSNFPNGSFVLV